MVPAALAACTRRAPTRRAPTRRAPTRWLTARWLPARWLPARRRRYLHRSAPAEKVKSEACEVV